MYLLVALILGLLSYVCVAKSLKEFSGWGFGAGLSTFIFLWVLMWFSQPVLSFSYGTWVYLLLEVGIITSIVEIARIICGSDDDDEPRLRGHLPLIATCVVGLWCMFTSTGMVASRSMQRMLDLTGNGRFSLLQRYSPDPTRIHDSSG